MFRIFNSRFIIAALAFLLVSACGTQGQEGSKLVSQSWMEFKNVARQYDSLQTVFEKMQEEDPELKKNPALLQAKLQDNMQEIYAIYQAIPVKAQAAIAELGPVDEYNHEDLRYVKLAAVSTNKLETALQVNELLVTMVKDADSLRRMKFEMAQFNAMLGNLDESAELATEKILAEFESMERAQLYSVLATGYAEDRQTDKASEYAMRAVRELGKSYRESAAEKTGKSDEDSKRMDGMRDQYYVQQYSELLTSVLFALKLESPESHQSFLVDVKKEIPAEDELWSQIQRFVDNGIKRLEAENASVNKDAAAWKEHRWIGSDPLSLDGLKGKVVLIDFFATWCKPCIMAFPHLKEWNDKYASDGLVIVGLTNFQGKYNGKQQSPDAEFASMKDDFIPKHKVSWTVGIEKSGRNTFQDYGVQGIPHMVLIDREGTIRYTKTGAGDYAKTERMIKKLLGE